MAKDLRYNKLAKLLCEYSVKVADGENVLLDMYEVPPEMVEALVEKVANLGANPFVNLSNSRINRKLALCSSDSRLQTLADLELARMKKMQAYIAIRGSNNIFESGDIPHEKVAKISSAMKAALNWRVDKTKWVVLRWPTPAMAQQAGMSTEAFEDFYFDVCTFDYSKLAAPMGVLRDLMQRTNEVRILGNGSAKPMINKHHSAHVLNVHEQFYLIDCGEGAQRRLIANGISLLRINAIFITHLHGDHVYGIFPMLSSMCLMGRMTVLNIYAPRPFAEILNQHIK